MKESNSFKIISNNSKKIKTSKLIRFKWYRQKIILWNVNCRLKMLKLIYSWMRYKNINANCKNSLIKLNW